MLTSEVTVRASNNLLVLFPASQPSVSLLYHTVTEGHWNDANTRSQALPAKEGESLGSNHMCDVKGRTRLNYVGVD